VRLAQLAELEYQRGMGIAAQHHIPYDKDRIREHVQNLTRILGYEEQVRLKNQVMKIEDEIAHYSNVPDVEEKEITDLSSKLQKMKLSSQTLRCPRCKGGLKFHDGRLVSLEAGHLVSLDARQEAGHLVSLDAMKEAGLSTGLQEIQECENRLNQMKSWKEMGERKKMLITMKNGFPTPLISNEEYQTYKSYDYPAVARMLASLQTLVVVEKPNPSSFEIQRDMRIKGLADRLDVLRKSMDITVNIHEIKNEYNRVQIEYTTSKAWMEKRNGIEAQVRDVKAQIAAIIIDDTLGPRMTTLRDSHEFNKKKHATHLSICSFSVKKMELEQKREELLKRYNEMVAINELKGIASRVECDSLQESVDGLNSTLEEVVGQLFTDPISIQLSLYKTTKTAKTKNTVNISMEYRGSQISNTKGISSGEADRVNMGLILALFKLSGCPFLLIDEAMPFSDSSAKEICLRVIRQNMTKNDLVIIVDHSSIEGTFDHVVNL
jgi:hypothetical protein